jgi:UDP-N-acetylmuramyl pentapeptide phosphotransferase/UDP-N-acetylglucosamine-1-phosphate transferase
VGLAGVPAWWLATHLCVGLAGTWLARRYALRRALIDHPGERRSHEVPTPRGGGLGVVVVLLLALAWLAFDGPRDRGLLAAMAGGLVLVAGIGWADDHRPLPAGLRLVVHAVAALLLGAGLVASGAGIPVAVAAALLALVLVNVWNFMDGINGLAASQAALAALGYLLLANGGPGGWLAAALMAGLLGFLPFNVPRARVFLGDVGSGTLGFALACTVGLTWFHAPEATSMLSILPLATFGIDAGLTLASRIVHGERWWEAHVSHAYQRWAGRSGHGVVTAAYAAWTLTGVVLMLHLPAWTWWSIVATGAYVMAGAGLWWTLRSRGVQRVDVDQ